MMKTNASVQSVKQSKTARDILYPAKVILLLSFWGCGALCLKSFATQTVCMSCMKSFLSNSLNTIYDTSFAGILHANNRLVVMFGLALCWLILMFFIERRKKC